MNILIQLLLSAVAVLVSAHVLPGVMVADFWVALVVAVVLALLNTVVRPVLVFFTIPITFFTLGLFLLVINALMVLIASALVGGFEVLGLGWALIFSILLALINGVLSSLAQKN